MFNTPNTKIYHSKLLKKQKSHKADKQNRTAGIQLKLDQIAEIKISPKIKPKNEANNIKGDLMSKLERLIPDKIRKKSQSVAE